MEETLPIPSSGSSELASVQAGIAFTKADFREVTQWVHRNRYFTNHGPLAREFESQLESCLGVSNVVTVGNESLAMLIAMAALELEGDLIVATTQNHFIRRIASWLCLEKVKFVEHASTDVLTFPVLAESLSSESVAVVIDETPDVPIDRRVIDQLIDCGLKVIVKAFDAFEIRSGQKLTFTHPDVVAVYSFSGERSVTTLQGGAIASNDADLAERYRNIRSSYGVRNKMDVIATCNGRFSEFQAGLGIKSLARLRQRIDEA